MKEFINSLTNEIKLSKNEYLNFLINYNTTCALNIINIFQLICSIEMNDGEISSIMIQANRGKIMPKEKAYVEMFGGAFSYFNNRSTFDMVNEQIKIHIEDIKKLNMCEKYLKIVDYVHSVFKDALDKRRNMFVSLDEPYERYNSCSNE